MKGFKYMLDKSSKKYLCPNPGCGKKTFVRFVDSITRELQPQQYGRCDREDSCGYYLYPKSEWLESTNLSISLAISRESQLHKEKEQVFVPWETLKTTWGGYDECGFIDNLCKKGVPDSLLEEIISMYYLGTINSGHLRGALTIPYINVDDNIAFVQVKIFDESNKTIKTNALHSILKESPGNDWVFEYEKNEQKVTCFFGAHLLKKYPNNPIVLVEAPKTAIYGACYYGVPKDVKDFLWLAVYNKSSLTEEKFKILEGRTILLMPDLSIDSCTFNKWQEKALNYAKKLNNTNVVVWDFLERNAPEELKKSGGDFADYLVQFSWQEYHNGEKGDESVKSDPEKKQFSEEQTSQLEITKIMDMFEPRNGYSKKEIIAILEGSFSCFNQSEGEFLERLVNECVLKRDYNRDNYYRYDSTPF